MLVHHLATILLITFSYANNMLRAGTLVMCVHDASDIFLEVKNCVMKIFFFFLFVPRSKLEEGHGFNSAKLHIVAQNVGKHSWEHRSVEMILLHCELLVLPV